MPSYELYRMDDKDEVIDHSVFACMTDHAAVHVAEAVAKVGGKVVIWRNGFRIGVLHDVQREQAPRPDRLASCRGDYSRTVKARYQVVRKRFAEVPLFPTGTTP